MKIYSKVQINLVTFMITILIYLFITIYIPKCYQTIREYFYYHLQPNIEEEYDKNPQSSLYY